MRKTMLKKEAAGLILGFFGCLAIGILIFALDFSDKLFNVAEYSAAYDIVHGNTPGGYTGKGIHWLKELLVADNQHPANPAVSASAASKPISIEDLKTSAEGGNSNAAYKLGIAYMKGAGVPKDAAQAAEWFSKAADQGNADAEAMLGELACPQMSAKNCNTYQSYIWFYLAAVNGNQSAPMKRDALEIFSTPIQLAAAQGAIGAAYYFGKGVPQNYAEAVKWWRVAAEEGNAQAQNDLGTAYQNGTGLVKDVAEAVKWYRKAAEQNNANAQYNLGNAYYQSLGIPKDDNEAMKWFRKAADQGYAPAQRAVGLIYREQAFQQRRDHAGEYYGAKAEAPGVVQGFISAYMWFNLAASQGDEEAVKNRENIQGFLNQEQIVEAQRLSGEWKPQHPETPSQ